MTVSYTILIVVKCVDLSVKVLFFQFTTDSDNTPSPTSIKRLVKIAYPSSSLVIMLSPAEVGFAYLFTVLKMLLVLVLLS